MTRLGEHQQEGILGGAWAQSFASQPLLVLGLQQGTSSNLSCVHCSIICAHTQQRHTSHAHIQDSHAHSPSVNPAHPQHQLCHELQQQHIPKQLNKWGIIT